MLSIRNSCMVRCPAAPLGEPTSLISTAERIYGIQPRCGCGLTSIGCLAIVCGARGEYHCITCAHVNLPMVMCIEHVLDWLCVCVRSCCRPANTKFTCLALCPNRSQCDDRRLYWGASIQWPMQNKQGAGVLHARDNYYYVSTMYSNKRALIELDWRWLSHCIDEYHALHNIWDWNRFVGAARSTSICTHFANADIIRYLYWVR